MPNSGDRLAWKPQRPAPPGGCIDSVTQERSCSREPISCLRTGYPSLSGSSMSGKPARPWVRSRSASRAASHIVAGICRTS